MVKSNIYQEIIANTQAFSKESLSIMYLRFTFVRKDKIDWQQQLNSINEKSSKDQNKRNKGEEVLVIPDVAEGRQ